MNTLTNSFFANIYLNAAIELGIDIQILNREFGAAILRHNDVELILYNNKFSINNSGSSILVKNKYVTVQILKKITNIVPAQRLFSIGNYSQDASAINKQIFEYANLLKFRIVIKPIGLSVATGVYILPNSKEKIVEAIEVIVNKYRQKYIIVENYFESDAEYRIITVNGKVVDILERVPAFVIGDSIHSLEELIEQKNIMRRKNGLNQIEIDNVTNSIIMSNNLSIKSVLPKSQSLQLKYTCNLVTGGETRRIDLNKLHRDYHDIFYKFFKITKLRFFGQI